MADTKLTLETIVKGTDKSTKQLSGLSNSISDVGKKLEQQTANLAKAGAAITAFGTASALGIKKLTDAAGEGAAITSSFNKLMGEEAPQALDRLRQATAGAVSDIDLMTASNNALLLGIDEKALPAMFEGALAASQATGRPVADAIGDITTGIGRQSKMILDNLGIMLDTAKANEEYAISLGKAASDLTDAEKKAAFMKATMDALNESSEKLGDITGNASIKQAQMTAQFKNATQALGEALLPQVLKLTQELTKLIERFNNLSPETKENIANIILLTTKVSLLVGPLLLVIGLLPKLAAGLSLLLSPIGLLITALGALFIAWETNFLGIRDITNEVMDAGAEKIAEFIEFLPFLELAVGEMALDVIDSFNLIKNNITNIINNVINFFTGSASAVQGSFKSMFQGLSEFVFDIFNDVINTIKSSVQSAVSFVQNIPSQIGGAISGIGAAINPFGGERANGGPVSSGTSYLVGERGPELFTPNVGGRITPNNALGGVTINISTMVGEESFARQMGDMIVQNLGFNSTFATAV